MSFSGVLRDVTNTTHLTPPLQEKVAERFVYQYEPNTTKLFSLMVVALFLASLSVLAALITFYMFVRMRRAFQHDLIMLLIQSDMMKAFWLLICPLAYFAHGPIDPSGVFCQVSGFFLTASIEAADIAVLMIAVHTALSLIRPERSSDPGLYPYRRSAYLCWTIVPLVLAGIVPLTGARFDDGGPNCYLPANPTWYRLMLSWVPRYIIFLAIFLTYVGIYAYVRFQLARFCRAQRRASNQSIASVTADCFCERLPRPHARHDQRGYRHPRYPHRKRRSSTLPVAPSIAQHGLLNTEQSGVSLAIGEYRDRQVSAGSTISTLKLDKQPQQQQQQQPTMPKPVRLADPHRIPWRPIRFNQNALPEIPPPPTISTADGTRGAGSSMRTHSNATTTIAFQSAARDAPSAADNDGLSPRTSIAPSHQPAAVHAPRSLWRRSIDQTGASARSVAGSLYSIVDILRWGPARQAGMSSSANIGPDDVSLPTDETEEAMRRSRDRMQRQLRLLFVYPAVYVLTWIAPLVAHASGLDNSFSREMQYWEDASDFRPGADGTNGTWHNGPMLASGGVNDTTSMGTGSAPPPPPSFGLEITTLVSLCIGAAVDCCFFSAWEKPWRHPRHRGVGFFGGLAACLHPPTPASRSGSGSSSTDRRRSLLADCEFLSHCRNGSGGSGSWMGLGRRVRPGRTREEQNRDARLAHFRRDQEVLDRAERARERERERARAAAETADGDAGAPGDGGESGMAGEPRREWWDAIDIDADENTFERRRHGATDGMLLDTRMIGTGLDRDRPYSY